MPTPRQPTTRRTSSTLAASRRELSRGTQITFHPNETVAVTLTIEGVYDYFCIPHEHAGMVGRIVVGHPEAADPQAFWGRTPQGGAEPAPEPARRAFPAVEEIMRRRVVPRT